MNGNINNSRPTPVINIFGQSFPLNWQLVVIVLALCIVICFFLYKTDTTEFAEVIIGGVYDVDGTITNGGESETVLYKFWTPSTETWNETSEEDKKLIEKKGHVCWYMTTERNIIDFGQRLIDKGAQGYTRSPCWGQGTTGLKPGWIWAVTFPLKRNFLISELTSLYQKYFCRNSNIYIEVYNIACSRHSQ